MKEDSTLKKRLSKKSIFNFEGIDFLSLNNNIIAYIDGLKIVPLKQSHLELLEKNFIKIDPNVLKNESS